MKKTAKQKKQSIVLRFSVIFGVITLTILTVSLILTYSYQSESYHETVIEKMDHICTELYNEMIADKDNFYAFQKYMQNTDRDRFVFDTDFDYKKDKAAFDKAFAKEYPGKVYGLDISFNEMSDELKDLFCYQYQEYWIERYEYYRELYNSPYTYYMYPTGEGGHILYIIDIERAEDEEAKDGRLLLWDNYEEDPKEMPVCFDIWNTGVDSDEIDVFHNDWGNTYSYYRLLYINGEKMGIIATDMDIDSVNRHILRNTISLTIVIGLVIIFGMIVLITYINKNYISRLSVLNEYIEEYSRDRDYRITEKIQNDITKNDEIGSLAWRIVAMINQIHCQLTDMKMVSETLSSTNEKVQKLTELSEQDGLTMLGNKLAFARTEQRLNSRISDKEMVVPVKFAIIMMDMNYLKKINDTYGHDKGDIALKKLTEYINLAISSEKHARAFRIGGDEYSIVLEDYESPENVSVIVETIRHYLLTDTSELPWEHISAAIGYSEFSANDTSFADVFKRADDEMYQNKKQMKAERKD